MIKMSKHIQRRQNIFRDIKTQKNYVVKMVEEEDI